jgi:hypothetical protein
MLRRIAFVLCTAVASLGLLATGASAESCPNEQLRAENHSIQLPECRAYEQVSPSDKNGYPVLFTHGLGTGTTASSPDGEAAVFTSYGTFAGQITGLPSTYHSQRTAAGWLTQPVSPRQTSPEANAITGILDVWTGLSGSTFPASADLNHGVITTKDSQDPTDINNAIDVYVHNPDGSTVLASRGNGAERTTTGDVAPFAGISSDGSHTYFSTSSHLVPQDAGRVEGADLYQRANGTTDLINEAPAGGLASACGSFLGDAFNKGRPTAIAPDGSHVIFSTPGIAGGADPSCQTPQHIYMHIDGQGTLDVSASQRSTPDPAGAQPATYIGAADNASIVYFGSREMLTNDAPVDGGAYAYDATGHHLAFIPGSRPDDAFLGASSDGSHAYFAGHNVELGELYDYTKGVRIGVVQGSDSLTEAATAVSVTPDGMSLMMTSRVPLTSYDSEGKSEVYLYHQGSGVICISCPTSGVPATSDASFQASQGLGGDGRHAFFETGAGLVPTDVNNRRDVYEYADGRLSLISAGTGPQDSLMIGSSTSGRDVFFSTYDSLGSRESDGGDNDIYDARVEGGFPAPVRTETATCTADECQGSSSAPPNLPIAGSAAFSGSGNLLSQAPPGSIRVLASTVTGRAAVLKLSVPGAGRLSASGAGLRQTVVTASKAGTYLVRVQLSQGTARLLAKKHRLALTVLIVFTPSGAPASTVRVRLTFRQSKRTRVSRQSVWSTHQAGR